VANSKLLVNQWRNEPSSHHLLGHQLAFTKSAQEPQCGPDARARINDCGLLRTFGDGCPEVFVIQAFMQFNHFWGYRSNNFFNSMRWAEDTSPKVRKSLIVGRRGCIIASRTLLHCEPLHLVASISLLRSINPGAKCRVKGGVDNFLLGLRESFYA
jgi:hypothetical protein